jgi:hypothetical protein
MELEKKLDELSAKVDKILETQELILNKLNQGIVLSKESILDNSKNKKLSKKEIQNIKIQEIKESIELRLKYGMIFKRQFNLAIIPSNERIKFYLRSNDSKAFDGLKRK